MQGKDSKKTNDELLFECKLCGTCCSRYCVPVTHYDLKRILAFLKLPTEGKSISEVAEFIEPDEEVMETYEEVPRPMIEDYETPDLILVLKSDEYCNFYLDEDSGCRIYPVRPIVCRFFPFTYEYERELDYSEPPPDLETYKVNFSINDDCDYCRGVRKGNRADLAALTKITHQGTREDAEFSKLINMWNLRVVFERTAPYDEDSFFEFLAQYLPPD